ncbi:MAG: hypothetical protein V1886_01910 [archaeon]
MVKNKEKQKMNEQDIKNNLEKICTECTKLQEESSWLLPVLEEDSKKKAELEKKQLELKKEYIKLQTYGFVGNDKIDSIHFCYTECDKNISKEK